MIEDALEKLAILLQGRVPEKIDTGKITEENERRLAEILNQLFTFMQETHEFIIPLAKGKLDEITVPPPKNFLGSPFKELHANLLHLTWQAKQVANGDYSQRVDFMGDFAEAFNSMIISLDENERMLKKKISELENALSRITRLEGILPICTNCKKIRLEGAAPDIQDSWVQIENYISKRTYTQFSHSICPECMGKLYPDLLD
jgi:hypothetical protein